MIRNTGSLVDKYTINNLSEIKNNIKNIIARVYSQRTKQTNNNNNNLKTGYFSFCLGSLPRIRFFTERERERVLTRQASNFGPKFPFLGIYFSYLRGREKKKRKAWSFSFNGARVLAKSRGLLFLVKWVLVKMNSSAFLSGSYVATSPCSSCCDIRFQPCLALSTGIHLKRCRPSGLKFSLFPRWPF